MSFFISRPRWVSDVPGEINAKFLGMETMRNPCQALRQEASPPRCHLAKLWKVARDRGAPPGAVADIRYSKSGYQFEIRSIGFALQFDAQCGVIEKGGT